jgi:hypothetical protein
MRKIDFIGQSVVLVAAAILLVSAAFHREMLYLFLYAQLFIGIWQYGSTFFSFLSGVLKYRRKYFFLSSIYLGGLAAILSLGNLVPLKIFLVYFFIPPWWLALYYYRMTWRSFFISQRNSSGFLPHTNF